MVFIDEKNIRFAKEIDCINIVEQLNESNTSIFFFCFNDEIKNEKINNVQSFLNGLIEGYFFHIQNYQQLKEFLANLSTNIHQTNFFKFDFNSFDNHL